MKDYSQFETIIRKYLKALKVSSIMEQKYYPLSDSFKEIDLNSVMQTKIYVESVIDAMKSDDRLFLENEFLFNYNRMWWINFYSKATYYRKRKKCIENFMVCYKENCSLLY